MATRLYAALSLCISFQLVSSQVRFELYNAGTVDQSAGVTVGKSGYGGTDEIASYMPQISADNTNTSYSTIGLESDTVFSTYTRFNDTMDTYSTISSLSFT